MFVTFLVVSNKRSFIFYKTILGQNCLSQVSGAANPGKNPLENASYILVYAKQG